MLGETIGHINRPGLALMRGVKALKGGYEREEERGQRDESGEKFTYSFVSKRNITNL